MPYTAPVSRLRGKRQSLEKNNYLSSRASSVSSLVALVAFLSGKSRNDTRASNNLQRPITTSEGFALSRKHPQLGDHARNLGEGGYLCEAGCMEGLAIPSMKTQL